MAWTTALVKGVEKGTRGVLCKRRTPFEPSAARFHISEHSQTTQSGSFRKSVESRGAKGASDVQGEYSKTSGKGLVEGHSAITSVTPYSSTPMTSRFSPQYCRIRKVCEKCRLQSEGHSAVANVEGARRGTFRRGVRAPRGTAGESAGDGLH